MCKALEYTNDLFNITENIKNEWKGLHNRLSIADKKISDIEHFIEFNNLNAANGYKAYKLLKEVLEERREVKNQIEELRPTLDFINGTHLTDTKKKTILYSNIEKKYNINSNSAENKKYNVRVLTDIFGEVI